MIDFSCCNYLNACRTSAVMLGLCSFVVLNTPAISDLRTVASDFGRLPHANSVTTMKSFTGILDGETAKLGPLHNTLPCGLDSLYFERFMTHLFNCEPLRSITDSEVVLCYCWSRSNFSQWRDFVLSNSAVFLLSMWVGK